MRFLIILGLLSFLFLTNCTKCSNEHRWTDEEYTKYKEKNKLTKEEIKKMEEVRQQQLEAEYQKNKKAFKEFEAQNPEYKKYPSITDPGGFYTLYSQMTAGEGSMKFTTFIDRLNQQKQKKGIIFEDMSFTKERVATGITIPKRGQDIMLEPRIDILKPFGKRKTPLVLRNENGIAAGPCIWQKEVTRISAFVKEIDGGAVLVSTDNGNYVWLYPESFYSIKIYKKGSNQLLKKIILPTEGSAVFKVHPSEAKAYVRVAIYSESRKIFKDYEPEIKDLGDYIVMEVTPNSFKFLSDKEYYKNSKRIFFEQNSKGGEQIENKNYRFEFTNDICT